MKSFTSGIFVVLALNSASVWASDLGGRALLGGGLGGALGAFVGSELSGRSGAIVGGALGAAAGSAIATDGYRERAVVREVYRVPPRPYYRDHGHYVYKPNRHSRHHHHYRHDYREPYRGFCPPGPGRQGRC